MQQMRYIGHIMQCILSFLNTHNRNIPNDFYDNIYKKMEVV